MLQPGTTAFTGLIIDVRIDLTGIVVADIIHYKAADGRPVFIQRGLVDAVGVAGAGLAVAGGNGKAYMRRPNDDHAVVQLAGARQTRRLSDREYPRRLFISADRSVIDA